MGLHAGFGCVPVAHLTSPTSRRPERPGTAPTTPTGDGSCARRARTSPRHRRTTRTRKRARRRRTATRWIAVAGRFIRRARPDRADDAGRTWVSGGDLRGGPCDSPRRRSVGVARLRLGSDDALSARETVDESRDRHRAHPRRAQARGRCRRHAVRRCHRSSGSTRTEPFTTAATMTARTCGERRVKEGLVAFACDADPVSLR